LEAHLERVAELLQVDGIELERFCQEALGRPLEPREADFLSRWADSYKLDDEHLLEQVLLRKFQAGIARGDPIRDLSYFQSMAGVEPRETASR
jgi:hypothetical protein